MYICTCVCVCTYAKEKNQKKRFTYTNKRLMQRPTIALVCVYEDLCMNTSQYICILTRAPTEYIVGSHQGTHVMYGGKVGGGGEREAKTNRLDGQNIRLAP